MQFDKDEIPDLQQPSQTDQTAQKSPKNSKPTQNDSELSDPPQTKPDSSEDRFTFEAEKQTETKKRTKKEKSNQSEEIETTTMLPKASSDHAPGTFRFWNKKKSNTDENQPLLSADIRIDMGPTTTDSDPNVYPLAQLIFHHIHETAPKITKGDLAKLGISLGVAGGSVLLYIDKYDYIGDNIAAQILSEVSVILANFMLAQYTTLETLNALFYRLPKYLAAAINESEKRNLVISIVRNVIFGALSLLGASPFAVATPVGTPVYTKLIIEITTAFVNMYGLTNLVYQNYLFLNNRITWRPTLAFPFIKRRSIEHLEHQQLLDSFTHSIRTITDEVLSLDKLPAEFSAKSTLTMTELVDAIADKAIELDIKPPQPLNTFQLIFRRVLPGVTGTSSVLLGLLATYILNLYLTLGDQDQPYYIENNNARWAVTGTVPLPFLYMAAAFAALVAFKIADFVTGNSQKTAAMKLYPKTTWAVMLTLLPIVALSGSKVLQMIHENPLYNKGGSLEDERLAAQILSAFSSIVVNGYAVFSLGNIGVETWARFFGSEEIRDKANFAHEMKKLEHNVRYEMSRTAFAQSFKDAFMTNNDDKEGQDRLMALLRMRSVGDVAEAKINHLLGEKSDDEKESTFSTLVKSFSSQLSKQSRKIYDGLTPIQKAAFQEMELTEAKVQIKQYGTQPQDGAPSTGEENVSVFTRFKNNVSNCMPSWPNIRHNGIFGRKPKAEIVVSEEDQHYSKEGGSQHNSKQ